MLLICSFLSCGSNYELLCKISTRTSYDSQDLVKVIVAIIALAKQKRKLLENIPTFCESYKKHNSCLL